MRAALGVPAAVAAIAAFVAPGAPSAAAVQRAQGLDRSAFIGRWTDDDDCRRVTFLGRNGWFVAPNGARGRWDVADDRLKLSGPGGVVSWRVVFEDPDTMTLISDDGARSQSTRCGAPERPRPI